MRSPRTIETDSAPEDLLGLTHFLQLDVIVCIGKRNFYFQKCNLDPLL